MISKSLLISIFFSSILFYSCNSKDNNWTHFRGSGMNGIAENESIPLKWDSSAFLWKTEIHDKGLSSPVVYKDQIWLTTGTPEGDKLWAVCLDFKTGKLIHDIRVFSPDEVERRHSVNTYATPTPCIEKGFVYVHYGSLGTACIKTKDGSIVWKRDDLKCRHIHGPGSSPILYKNLVILHFDGADERYIVALDKSTGKQVWRADRPIDVYEPLSMVGKLAYLTPIIINVKGRDMLISNGSAICQAFDPNTGKEIWRLVDGQETTIAMPFSENGVLYWYTGFNFADDGKTYTDLLAINPDGEGDLTNSKNIIWNKKDETADNQMLSPIIKDGLIYTVTTKDTMMCIDAAIGKEVWSTRVKAGFNASPVYIDGNLWFFSIKGDILVIKSGREYEVVAQNQMESGIWATPAVLRNSMLLRVGSYLYRIGG